MTEEYIAVEARMSEDLYERVNERALADHAFLGLVNRFVIHGDEEAVSLPEDSEGLAKLVEMDFENPRDVSMYCWTGDVDWSKEYEEVTLGLGICTEPTIPDTSGMPAPDTWTIKPVQSHAIGEKYNNTSRTIACASICRRGQCG